MPACAGMTNRRCAQSTFVIVPRKTSCAEKFSEALFYLGITFFQLVGVRGQKFQILELGLVRRIGDLRMTGIKTFLIRQQLLRLFGKNKLSEEFRRIGMRR